MFSKNAVKILTPPTSAEEELESKADTKSEENDKNKGRDGHGNGKGDVEKNGRM